MEDTGYTVRCLRGEGNLAVNGVKGDPKIYQVGNSVRGFVDEDAHRLCITQAISSGDGILEV